MAGIFGYVPNNTLGALYLTPQTGNEARWRQALANQGSISKTRPTLGGRLENLTVDTLRKAGVSDRTAARLGSKTFSAVNDLTPVGNLTGADEGAAQFGRGLTRGDLGQAALGAGVFGLSVFPGAAGRVVGKVGKGMFGRLMRDEIGAIRAWHGSPHDFDRFSLSKIGTGEGAQAYGHGLYFAENPDVARQYQNILGFKHTNGAPPVDWGNDPASGAAHSILMSGGDRDAAVRSFEAIKVQQQRILDRVAKGLPVAPWAEKNALNEVRNADAAIAHIRNGTEAAPPNPGRLYEVNINADPQDFLDWDAPLGGQSSLHDPVRNYLGASGFDLNTFPQFAQSSKGMNISARTPEQVARLRNAGIPGIRYLDQGSRGAADGTRNYVVFDDSLIDILNKF